MGNFSVSILIPVLNESAYIEQCLNSILINDFPKQDMEIIIIDGGSSDDTREIISKYKWPDVSHTLLTHKKKIVPISLNMGIQQAKGKYIIRIDAHTLYAKDYISKCAEYLDKGIADNVGGPMRPMGDKAIQKAIKYATCSKFGIGNSSFHFEHFEGFVDTVYLGAFRKEVFSEIGYFDEELVRNQDDELNFRLILNGKKIYLSPEIISYYYPRDSLQALWKQYFEYGFWKVRVIQKHKQAPSLRHFIPCCFALTLTLLPLFSAFYSPAFYLLLFFLFIYASANFHATTVGTRNQPVKISLLVGLTYFILHASYGFGFLKGFFKFYFFPFNKTR
ncbi:MAG: glycosyltransferase family 2 protein [Fibrobacteria bacterium]|nr:glycosyltransferase family 2 protein [Fibrobacteria bacterium]